MIGSFIRLFFVRRRKRKGAAPPEQRPPFVDPSYGRPAELAREGMRALMEATRLPGLSVAVARRGELVWSEGFGFADLAARRPVTPGTQFRIASVSKVLTAAALVRLWQQGRLDLDAPLSRLLPEWPHAADRITPRLLAGHLGGIRHYLPGDFRKGIDLVRYRSSAEALAIFRDDPLVAPPGEQYHYTTFGYTLLSAAMERAAGRDFFSIMTGEVLQPLGLRHTAPNHPDFPAPQLTTLYAPDSKGGWKTFPNQYPAYKWAGGGYVSTSEELARFGLAHLRPGFLEPRALEQLFTPQCTTDGSLTGVGLGWVITRDARGRTLYFHNGSQGGARSLLSVYPDDQLVIAILSNAQNVPQRIETTAASLAEWFLGSPSASGSDGYPGFPQGAFQCLAEPGGELLGVMRFSREGGDFNGTLDRSPPEGIRTSAPLLNITPVENGWRASVATEEGLIPLDLYVEAGEWRATVRFGADGDPGNRTLRLVRV